MITIITNGGLPYTLIGNNGIRKKFRDESLLWSEADYIYTVYNSDGSPLATTDIYQGMQIDETMIKDSDQICFELDHYFTKWTPSSGGTGSGTTIDGMSGDITLSGGTNITITDDPSNKTITISSPLEVTLLNKMDGRISIEGSGNTTVTTDQEGKIITIYSSGGTGGGGTVDGMSNVTLSAGTGISINDEFDENRIDISNTGVTSLGIQDAQSTLTGDIRLEPGSGISLVYDAHQNCINISATGVPPVSAGVETINSYGGIWEIGSDNLEVVTETTSNGHSLKLNMPAVQDKMSFYMSQTDEMLVTPSNFPVGSIIGQLRCDIDNLVSMTQWNEVVLQQGSATYTVRWGKASNGVELLSILKNSSLAIDLYQYNPTTFETTIHPSTSTIFGDDVLWDASRNLIFFSHTETILSEEIVDVTNTALYSTLDYTTMVQQIGYANSFLTFQQAHQGRLVDPE